MVEKFSIAEVSALRQELLGGRLDALQAGELLQMFLMGHGYGVSPEPARAALRRMGDAGCSMDVIRRELDGLALVM
ncbi:MAG: hypothetical protein L0099_13065 [Acidobacteria bacterium]|nr:hypothetical protein [Acidobacteriota bacterium]